MGERDWLTELTSALGDGDGDGERALAVVPDPDTPPPPAPAAAAPPAAPEAAPPPVDDELDLMGPGRSLDGWAEELASAFAEDDEPVPDDVDGAEGPLGPAVVDDGVLRFDSLVAVPAPVTPEFDADAVRAAVDAAVAGTAADLTAGFAADAEASAQRLSAAEARLERIESLLTADLSQLGPAVLADSVGDLEDRLIELRAAVSIVTERVEALPVPEPETLAALAAAAEAAGTAGAAGVDGDELAGSLGELRALVDRLTDRVAAQARFLAAHADTTAADAHQRDDILRAILARLDGLG